jgi:hypothetical protein
MIGLALAVFSVWAKPVSQVFTGNWSGEVVYSSQPLPDLNLNFTVRQGSIPNYLSTSFDDHIVLINLSYTDLSGNISFQDGVFHFNFTRKAPPFVSSDIDMGDLGLLHCILASYEAIRCAFTNGENTASFFLTKTSKSPGLIHNSYIWVKRNFLGICLIILLLIVYYLFKRYMDRTAQEDDRKALEARQQREKEKQEEDNQTALEGGQQGENPDAIPKDENMVEGEPPSEPQEREPDENGKFKTD